MDRILDLSFVVFHTALIAFNLTGWIWRATRRLHLLTISATLLSWFGLGLVFGWGYCPCTDWHWQIKRSLGESNLPVSYITYYLNGVTGFSWNPDFVDAGVLVLGLLAFLASAGLNVRDHRHRSRES